jgi:outer membrane receptor protein involved in Fe transport
MRRILATLLVLGSVSLPLAAEESTELSGHVADGAGQSLPGVAVVVRGGDVSRETFTDANGTYALAVPQGTYDVSFRLASFATAIKRGIVVDGRAARQVDATLPLKLSTDVLVTAKKTFGNLADLDGAADLVGVASAASEGVVSAAQIEERPAYRVGEVLETVPGVVISQHSGEGKANQYYVRGFNIDHGTDLASTVAGIPVNLPTHGHGQGYSDLNFVMPELVSGVQYKKGPYYADEGDFSAAGAINVNYLNVLDHPMVKVEAGQDAYGRLFAAGSPAVGRGHLLYAAEILHHDGPWVHPDDYRKLNAVVRYSQGTQQDGFSVTGMAYDGRWDSTDQVPDRAIASGAIDRFGAIDPSDGGTSRRFAVAGDWKHSGQHSVTEAQAYGIVYRMTLFSDFTYFLDDPVNGDQFEQEDRRTVAGFKLSHRFLGDWGGRDVENLIGVQLRNDWIPTVGLYHTHEREILNVVRKDGVTQGSVAPFAQNSTQWTPWLRTIAGLRADVYHFDVASSDPANSGTATASLVSPKLTAVLGPWDKTEVYADVGYGFHSNDGRGATVTRDPETGGPAQRVDPLVRAKGAEIGARTTAFNHVQSTLTFWGLDIGSELVFVGDAGTTEASRPSRRAGFEWANYATLARGVTLDADVAYSRARFRDDDPAGDRIPGAVEGVASIGLSADDIGRVSGSVRLRYFGPRPLIEDDSVRSKAATVLNARLGYRINARYRATLDVFNLTDAAVSDVDYFYASRLPGEPAAGALDIHTHPLEPRSVRFSLSATF